MEMNNDTPLTPPSTQAELLWSKVNNIQFMIPNEQKNKTT